MKKILALILCITLLCAIIVGCDKGNGDEKSTTTPTITTTKASAEATTAPGEDIVGNPASDFEYQETENGDIKITRYIGKSENVVVPRLINGKKVTELAFKNFQDNIATIYIPDTVVMIAGSCFRNAVRLEKVDFSEGLKEIGHHAFENCTSLNEVTIPSTVETIGDLAFSDSGLVNVVFKDGIEMIGGYGSFANTKLKKLVLPSTAKEIGHSAFAACTDLETVILNEGLVKIGHKAFTNNPKLKEIVIPKTVEIVTEMDFNMCSGLEKIMFEGNAPATFEYSDIISGVWKPSSVNFTIYYHEGAIGFTSPIWYGYTTKIW